ncbi:MAG TPA: MnmC family methyltransferase [Verrucomicrobiae bacterium]|nr:MnmC family methyltransferase [Verrucomicrobiae bacterium]
MHTAPGYKLVRLRNGAFSVRSLADDETFHPGIGPVAEAEALYVRQLRLPERIRETDGEFVIWDVGLGAAANALTAIRLIRENLTGANLKKKRLRVVSFDRTGDALSFALRHSAELDYLAGNEIALNELLKNRFARIESAALEVNWTFELCDFPILLSQRRADEIENTEIAPHAILFDPHSPKKNPAMWTISVFENLFHRLDLRRPCALADFTRSTMARTAILLGGFYVGIGRPSGLKEETTVAANRIELLGEPLDRRWLERAKRSDSAEPLREAVYRREPLSAETLKLLERHPQFSPAESQMKK